MHLLHRLTRTDQPVITFTVDGVTCEGRRGDTLLTAVLSFSEHLRQSDFSGEPRAGFTNGTRIGLNWITRKSDDGRDLTWHNGGTGGYRTFIGFIPAARVGIVVLTNAATNPDPLALQALNALAKK